MRSSPRAGSRFARQEPTCRTPCRKTCARPSAISWRLLNRRLPFVARIAGELRKLPSSAELGADAVAASGLVVSRSTSRVLGNWCRVWPPTDIAGWYRTGTMAAVGKGPHANKLSSGSSRILSGPAFSTSASIADRYRAHVGVDSPHHCAA